MRLSLSLSLSLSTCRGNHDLFLLVSVFVFVFVIVIVIGGLGQMGVRLSQGDITMNITLSSGAFGEGDGEYGDCNLDLPWKRSRCSRDWGGQVKITS